MKIQTKELSGTALDWAVAKCEGYREETGFPQWMVIRGLNINMNHADYYTVIEPPKEQP